MLPDDPRHGSVAGYSQHRKSGDIPACDSCKAAVAKYQANRDLMRMRGQSHTIPAIGTVRRIQALVRMGWPMPVLSERLGAATPQTIQNLARKPRARIRVATAQKIAALYDELAMTPGPSRVSATRARNRGWPAPLAWDDIDNPNERPQGTDVCSAGDCANKARHMGHTCATHYRRAA